MKNGLDRIGNILNFKLLNDIQIFITKVKTLYLILHKMVDLTTTLYFSFTVYTSVQHNSFS